MPNTVVGLFENAQIVDDAVREIEAGLSAAGSSDHSGAGELRSHGRNELSSARLRS